MHEPRCPRCGSELPLRALWAFARLENRYVIPGFGFINRSGLLSGRIGIACPRCLAKYKVVQTRIRIIRALAWTLLFTLAWWFGVWNRDSCVLTQTEIRAIALAGVGFLLLSERLFTPYLAWLRPAKDNENLGYPLRSAYEGAPP